jgi:hypothetical protein
MHRLGARDVGATAVHISETTSGVAFVRIEGACAIRRVRASYLTNDDIAAIASRSRRRRPCVIRQLIRDACLPADLRQVG